ncbi:hypothetical protein [Kitasatospora purpeofusca]|uniref:hypothetical protein n=1 Tax=Kitasatospora purpeofusca TaxID=67352 RepID=UPI0036D2C12E
MPVLMVEVDRSTMSPERVAAKFTVYRELFRTKVKSTDPTLADQEPADRMVHWWRRTWLGHTRPGYPPVALVVTGAGPVALANRQEAVADLSVEVWGGQWPSIVGSDAAAHWHLAGYDPPPTACASPPTPRPGPPNTATRPAASLPPFTSCGPAPSRPSTSASAQPPNRSTTTTSTSSPRPGPVPTASAP